MPKAPIPVGYSKVVVQGTYGGTSWANVLYFDTETSDPGFPNDAMAAAKLAARTLYADLAPHNMSDQWTTTTFKVTYRADSSSTYTVTLADAIAGADADTGEDAQVCYLINWVSGDARRGGKPRTYIPGVENSAMLDRARLNTTFQGNYNTAIDSWLAAFPFTVSSGHATALVEMSFVNAKADRVTPVAIPIVSGHVNPVVATQRRRVDRERS